METKQDLLLATIKKWIEDYEGIDELDTEYTAELADNAFSIFLQIKDSIEMGEL